MIDSANYLSRHIGRTPMLGIRYRLDGREGEVLVKCEQYNLSGSIKDRVVLAALQQAIKNKQLIAGQALLHIGSGNTAVSLAVISKAMGLRVTLLTTGWENLAFKRLFYEGFRRVELHDDANALNERALLLEAYGFMPLVIPAEFAAGILEKTAGREAGYSLLLEDIRPAAWVAGTGSGATFRDISRYLSRLFPELLAIPVTVQRADPAPHRIHGLSQQPAKGECIRISETDAIAMTRKICRELQLSAGYSAGANLLAAIQLQKSLGGLPVVTVFPDDYRRYEMELLPESSQPEPPGHLVQKLELLGCRELKTIDT